MRFREPLALDRPNPKAIVRFMQHVWVGPTGCWKWTGHLNDCGYGQFNIRIENGHVSWHRVAAHRVAYAIFYGHCPSDKTVDHKCLNPYCVNPDHLQLMDWSDNVSEGNTRRTRYAGSELEITDAPEPETSDIGDAVPYLTKDTDSDGECPF